MIQRNYVFSLAKFFSFFSDRLIVSLFLCLEKIFYVGRGCFHFFPFLRLVIRRNENDFQEKGTRPYEWARNDIPVPALYSSIMMVERPHAPIQVGEGSDAHCIQRGWGLGIDFAQPPMQVGLGSLAHCIQ